MVTSIERDRVFRSEEKIKCRLNGVILCSFCDKSCYKNRLFVRVFETVDTSVSLRGMTSDRESSPLEHP